MNAGKDLRCDGDACLFGMGTNLLVERQVVSWCAVPLNKDDEVCLGIVMGDETYQQEAECLRQLVALRLWKSSGALRESDWKCEPTTQLV